MILGDNEMRDAKILLEQVFGLRAVAMGHRRNLTTVVGKVQTGVLPPVFSGSSAARRSSARCASPLVRFGVLHDALFVSLSVLHDVSCVPLGGRSAGIAAPPDDSLVSYGA